MATSSPYNINAAIEAFKNGKPVIIMDSEDRENEGDICLPAQFVTKEDVSFFLKYSTGILCVATNPLRIEELELEPMTRNNTDPNGTPFTVSVDLHSKHGTSTGVSNEDKAKTIRALADSRYTKDDFTKPGHMYPLRASPYGLLGRQGHTESSVELCNQAGVYPACLIAELMHKDGPLDGEMMRDEACIEFAQKHGLPIVRISDILEAMPPSTANLPISISDNTVNTKLKIYDNGKTTYAALVKGDVKGKENVYLRIHSECLTGDIFKSTRCDCYSQLQLGLDKLNEVETGILVYIKGHEGRGIGIHNKVKCYSLQDTGKYDTVTANNALYLPSECRNYDYLPKILEDLGVKTVTLYSNNPDKIGTIGSYLADVKPFIGVETPQNKKYLQVKAEKLHRKPKRKIGLTYISYWHKEDINKMVSQVREFFSDKDYELVERPVPGSFELVMGAKKLIDQGCATVITLGIVLKGDTHHYERISEVVTEGLMSLQLQTKVPIVYGLLSCLTPEHIEERVSGKKNAVLDWCQTALDMIN